MPRHVSARGPAPRAPASAAAAALLGGAVALLAATAPWPAAAQLPSQSQVAPQGNRIVAVVNGDVVSQADVVGRARLFALSAGIPVAPDMLERLAPQVTRLLID